MGKFMRIQTSRLLSFLLGYSSIKLLMIHVISFLLEKLTPNQVMHSNRLKRLVKTFMCKEYYLLIFHIGIFRSVHFIYQLYC